MRNKNKIAVALLLVIGFLARAESFRVHAVENAEISVQQKSQKKQLKYNDALAIIVPQNKTFLQGIEIEIKIPQELLNFRGSIAYSLYTDVTPHPQSGKIDFTANRVHIDVIPPRLSLAVQIPIIKPHKIKESPYALLLNYSELIGAKVIFFRLQPVMKGLPDNIEDLIFDIDVKPILSNEGLLELAVLYPKETDDTFFTLYIDEQPVKFAGEPLLLPAGMHHLAIVSESFKNEFRTFSIEQAKTTQIQVALQDTIPTVTITAPQNAIVYLDGNKVKTGEAITITAQIHTIRFVLGDYEVIKTIQAVTGKSYDVSLTIDASITENP